MTAQQLKNSILQMAVQGKLVPQNSDDEPASVLLEHIKAEKEELFKAGKIKKYKKSSEIFRGASRNLPYAYCEQIGKEIQDISDEIPFDIPDTWEWCRLSFANEMYTGNSINESEKKAKYLGLSNGRYYIGTKDVEFNHTIVYENGVKIPFDADKFRIAPCSSILMCIEGGSAGRKIAFTDYEVCFGNKLCCFVSYGVDYKFLYYYLQSPIFQSAFKENTTGIIGGVSVNTLKNMLLPVPPIGEQKRIVDRLAQLIPFLDEYDKAETQLTVLNTTFPELLNKSILQEAVQGRLVPQNPDDEPASVLLERIRTEKQALIKAGKIKKDKHESVIVTRDKIPYEIIDGKERCIADEVPFELPENWCWCRLGEVSKNIQYGTSQKSTKEGKIPVLRMGNLQNGRIIYDKLVYTSDDDEISHYPLLYNDLLFNRTNSREIVGKTAIYKAEMPAIYAGYLVRITPMIDSDYLNYVMQSQYYWIYCQTVRSDAIGQSNINAEKLKHFLVPVPPIEEQHRIVSKIEEIMPYINTITK